MSGQRIDTGTRCSPWTIETEMTNNCRPPLTNIHQTSAPLEQHPPFPPPLKTKDFQKSPPSDLSDLRRTSRDFVARSRPKQGSLRSPRGRLVASLEKQQQQLNSVVLCVQRKKKKSKCPSQCGVIWSPLEVDREHLSFSPHSYALRAIK